MKQQPLGSRGAKGGGHEGPAVPGAGGWRGPHLELLWLPHCSFFLLSDDLAGPARGGMLPMWGHRQEARRAVLVNMNSCWPQPLSVQK